MRFILVVVVVTLLASLSHAQACTTMTFAQACANKHCGNAFNGTCYTQPQVNCGVCPRGLSCGAINQCLPGSCSAELDEDFCVRVGAECGTVQASDNCGVERRVDCSAMLGDCNAVKPSCSPDKCSCASNKCLFDDGSTQCMLGVTGQSNNHGQVCSRTEYPFEIGFGTPIPDCQVSCRSMPMLSTCSPTETFMFSFTGQGSPVTNAHIGLPGTNWGAQRMCCVFEDTLSGGVCGNLSCDWIAGSCSAGNTTVMRASGLTNAHVSVNQYPNHLCCEVIFQCDDGIDNDGDGYIDCADCVGKIGTDKDPGCGSEYDNTETNDFMECDDGIDNDGDGLIDYRAPGILGRDPGCTNPTDNDEWDDTPHVIECSASCTETIDGFDTGICRSSCQGDASGCPIGGVFAGCDGRSMGSSSAYNQTHFTYCCGGGEQFVNINAADLKFETTKDIVRSTRISRTSSGDTIIMNINTLR